MFGYGYCCCPFLPCYRFGIFPKFAERFRRAACWAAWFSNGLRTGFNMWGANLVVIALLDHSLCS